MDPADALPDDCTCSWINYSDSTGWFLKSRDPYCPSHGYQEPIGEGPPDGNNPRTGIAWNE